MCIDSMMFRGFNVGKYCDKSLELHHRPPKRTNKPYKSGRWQNQLAYGVLLPGEIRYKPKISFMASFFGSVMQIMSFSPQTHPIRSCNAPYTSNNLYKHYLAYFMAISTYKQQD